jgi:hypothetical protein
MAFQSVLARMHDRLLAKTGEQAVLRLDTPCRANIERGVQVTYEIGDAKFHQSEFAEVVDVANLPARLTPTPGDPLTVIYADGSSESFVIDAIAANNGHLARCVLRSA